ncbi:MAG: hypothetical protein U0790_01890 [Isosphaeraceae bacterium]
MHTRMVVFASLGPLAFVLAFAVVAVAAYVAFRVVSVTRTVMGKAAGPTRRRAPAWLSLVCGPLVGLALGLVHLSRGGVNPLDVGYTIGQYTFLGAILGAVTAGALAVADWLASRQERPRKPSGADLRELE